MIHPGLTRAETGVEATAAACEILGTFWAQLKMEMGTASVAVDTTVSKIII
jgi:hypothetical protein